MNQKSEDKETKPQKIKESSLLDLRIAWKIYKDNKKTFISFALFSFFGALLASIIFSMITLVFLFGIINSLNVEPDLEKLIIPLMVIFTLPTLIIMFALYGSIYGLTYDIMTSGDEFAELRSAFTYFRKYWWQYTLLSLISGLINMIGILIVNPDLPFSISNQISYEMSFVISTIIIIIGWNYYLLFILTMPSITAQGSLKQSFIENFRIIKSNSKRLYKTGWLYFVIFSLPSSISLEIMYLYLPSLVLAWRIVLIIIILIIYFGTLIIGNPLFVIMMTRIYNSNCDVIPIKKEKDENQIKIEKSF